MDELDRIIKRWTNAEDIRLHVGEVSPKEMETILAVTKGFASEIENELRTKVSEGSSANPVKEDSFRFSPDSDITVNELASIFAATLDLTGIAFKDVADNLKRHFKKD